MQRFVMARWQAGVITTIACMYVRFDAEGRHAAPVRVQDCVTTDVRGRERDQVVVFAFSVRYIGQPLLFQCDLHAQVQECDIVRRHMHPFGGKAVFNNALKDLGHVRLVGFAVAVGIVTRRSGRVLGCMRDQRVGA